MKRDQRPESRFGQRSRARSDETINQMGLEPVRPGFIYRSPC